MKVAAAHNRCLDAREEVLQALPKACTVASFRQGIYSSPLWNGRLRLQVRKYHRHLRRDLEMLAIIPHNHAASEAHQGTGGRAYTISLFRSSQGGKPASVSTLPHTRTSSGSRVTPPAQATTASCKGSLHGSERPEIVSTSPEIIYLGLGTSAG